MAKKEPRREDERPAPWTPPALSSRHRATVAAIFAVPTRADVTWRSFVGLVAALGGLVQHGRGSRRRIKVGPRRANLHEPHPGATMPKGAVEDARDFLRSLGVVP
jgi:hypothetical protein